MEDLKSLGDKPDLKYGNREAAILVGMIFVIMVVVFGLGVMVGKRIYEKPQQPVAMLTTTPTEPTVDTEPVGVPATEPAATEPATKSTAESHTFYNLRKDDQPQPGETPTKTDQPTTVETDTPEPKETPEPKPTPVKPKTSEWKWSIQVGAFLRRENSAKAVEKLRDKGLNAWIQRIAPKKAGNVYYAIRVGKYKDYNKAREDIESFKSAGLIPQDSFIRGRKR